jgi:hypothetical protein
VPRSPAAATTARRGIRTAIVVVMRGDSSVEFGAPAGREMLRRNAAGRGNLSLSYSG